MSKKHPMRFSIRKKTSFFFAFLVSLAIIEGVLVFFLLADFYSFQADMDEVVTYKLQSAALGNLRGLEPEEDVERYKLDFMRAFDLAENSLEELEKDGFRFGGLLREEIDDTKRYMQYYRTAFREFADFQHQNHVLHERIKQQLLELTRLLPARPALEHERLYGLIWPILRHEQTLAHLHDIEGLAQIKKAESLIKAETEDQVLLQILGDLVRSCEANYVSWLGVKDRETFLDDTKLHFLQFSDSVLATLNDQYHAGQTRTIYIVFALLFLIIVCVFSLWLSASNYLSRFLDSQHHAIESIKAGEYDYEPGITADDELGDLAKFMKDMATSLKESIEHLEGSEGRFRAIMDSSEALVYVADMETYEILFLNEHGRGIFGAVEGQRCWEVLQQGQTGPCEFCTNDKIVTSDGKPSGMYVWEHKNTVTNRWFECRDQAILWPDGRLVRMEVANDVTARKTAAEERARLEAQLRQAQKMESIGTLAGGIAHDFNNILAIILGYTELVMVGLPEASKERERLAEVFKAASRAKDLVRQILSFSRKSEQDLQPVRPGDVVRESVKMLRATIPTTVDIQESIDLDHGVIIADPTQIHQIITNLGMNGVHAMNEKGVLGISLKRVDFEEGNPLLRPGMASGAYMRLSVSDTGHGIPPAFEERIFDPFFTTKEVGKGTGLGLSVVHGIVVSHHGMIKLENRVGKGATFHVYFALADEEEVRLASQALVLPSGSERILFVDDEVMLTKIGAQRLEDRGYRVTTRNDSREALDSFRSKPDEYDLVITDQAMPKMSGLELAGELLKIRPDIPVILCTGYSSKVSEGSIEKKGIRALLMKPHDKGQLLTMVRKVLDGTG